MRSYLLLLLPLQLRLRLQLLLHYYYYSQSLLLHYHMLYHMLLPFAITICYYHFLNRFFMP